jgi:hypothetical protein
MGILNRPSDGLASALVALHRTVLAYGPLSSERLLALAAPPSVIDAKSDLARKTLTRWTQLRAFVPRGDERLALAPELSTLAHDDIDGMRKAALRVVLAAGSNDGLDAHSADANSERPLASDFTRAVCWALAQDPYSLGTTYHSDPAQPSDIDALQRHQCAGGPIPFQNDTRWSGFVDWACFLGFGWKAPKFLLDPFFAVDCLLSQTFDDKQSLPIDAFLESLAALGPVFDGGSYRQTVEATLARPPARPNSTEVSSTLSLALMHLEAAGTLKLETRSDAPTRFLLGRRGQQLHGVTHVSLLRGRA